MKSIGLKLSKLQVDRLLILCAELFDEYDYIEMRNGYLFFNIEEKIHWFEFCMTHLAVKFKKFGIEIDYWLMTLGPNHCQWPKGYNHPVDYLYEKFLELK